MLLSYVATACEGIGNIQNVLHDHPPVVGCLVCPWHPFFVPYNTNVCIYANKAEEQFRYIYNAYKMQCNLAC